MHNYGWRTLFLSHFVLPVLNVLCCHQVCVVCAK